MATSLDKRTQLGRTLGACLILVVATLILYWPTAHYGFVLVGDGEYVSNNPHVTDGLSWAGAKWAFTTFYAGNWHPLTWISHMLDCSLFGPFADGQHFTNLILHTLNTVFLFLVLKRMTGAFWRSWIVAALFGWHPVHVESVAWIAERKDVLSTFFLMLTLWSYAIYVEAKERRRKIAYGLTVLFFIFGLMSKPILVTVPFILLLLDFWPLQRKPWRKLVMEKIPLFALAMASCAITLIAQRSSGAMREVAETSFGLRIANALIAYINYLGNTFWPAKLSIHYLPPNNIMAFAAMGLDIRPKIKNSTVRP